VPRILQPGGIKYTYITRTTHSEALIVRGTGCDVGQDLREELDLTAGRQRARAPNSPTPRPTPGPAEAAALTLVRSLVCCVRRRSAASMLLPFCSSSDCVRAAALTCRASIRLPGGGRRKHIPRILVRHWFYLFSALPPLGRQSVRHLRPSRAVLPVASGRAGWAPRAPRRR
jgi:hypothetical protein